MKASADSNGKRVTLELGGKSPLIVFEDAIKSTGDLDRIVEDITMAILSNTGQNCCAGSRLLVQRGIYRQLIERLIERISRVKIGGDPLDESTEYGPLISQQQLDRVLNAVDSAVKRSNNTLLIGGKREPIPGFYMQPTGICYDSYFTNLCIIVFANVDDCDYLAVNEIFGPVLTVLKPFSTEQEAIDRANQSELGLAAGLWTNDLNRAERIIPQLEAGTTWVNTYNSEQLPSMPFGGMKQSGFGYDLGDESVLYEYTQSKSVVVKINRTCA